MLICTKTKLSSVQVTDLHLSSSTIPLSPYVKNLGVVLDNTLSVKRRMASSLQPSPDSERIVALKTRLHT